MRNGFSKWMIFGVMVLCMSQAAMAVPACDFWTLSGSATNTTLLTVLSGGGAGEPCLAYGLTFNNFQVFLNTGFPGSGIFSITASFGLNGVVSFGATATTGQDYDVEFSVTPGVNRIVLQNNGGVGINEVVCSQQITLPGGSCSVPNTLAVGNIGPTGSTAITVASSPTGTDWVFKDVNGSSTFSQTFVPEPVTVSLMGAGLLVLGLLRRRKNRQ